MQTRTSKVKKWAAATHDDDARSDQRGAHARARAALLVLPCAARHRFQDLMPLPWCEYLLPLSSSRSVRLLKQSWGRSAQCSYSKLLKSYGINRSGSFKAIPLSLLAIKHFLTNFLDCLFCGLRQAPQDFRGKF